jgi:hypothetical protein
MSKPVESLIPFKNELGKNYPSHGFKTQDEQVSTALSTWSWAYD